MVHGIIWKKKYLSLRRLLIHVLVYNIIQIFPDQMGLEQRLCILVYYNNILQYDVHSVSMCAIRVNDENKLQIK